MQKFQRDPDTESPAGGVSSSVNDLAKWMRLELANGKFEGKTIVNEKALAEARRPHMLTGHNPLPECQRSTAWAGTLFMTTRGHCT